MTITSIPAKKESICSENQENSVNKELLQQISKSISGATELFQVKDIINKLKEADLTKNDVLFIIDCLTPSLSLGAKTPFSNRPPYSLERVITGILDPYELEQLDQLDDLRRHAIDLMVGILQSNRLISSDIHFYLKPKASAPQKMESDNKAEPFHGTVPVAECVTFDQPSVIVFSQIEDETYQRYSTLFVENDTNFKEVATAVAEKNENFKLLLDLEKMLSIESSHTNVELFLKLQPGETSRFQSFKEQLPVKKEWINKLEEIQRKNKEVVDTCIKRVDDYLKMLLRLENKARKRLELILDKETMTQRVVQLEAEKIL